jgi:SMI1-KNR4 cell-wall
VNSDKVEELGARLIGQKTSLATMDNRQVEPLLRLAPSYRDLLIAVGGGIVFDKGARYVPETVTPFTKADGYNSLELLYGLGNEQYSLTHKILEYNEQLPQFVIPIGEAPGGNLLCVNQSGSVLLWDHESPLDGKLWHVATSLESFIERLEPDESKLGSTEGIVESESFLDF